MRSGAFFCVRDLSAAQARDGAGCRISIAGKPAPTGSGCSTGQGWGRLQGQHRRQAGSHRYWVQCRPCGSWLARDGAGCRVSIAGKPAPTGNGCSAGLGWGRLQSPHRRQAGSHRYRVQRRPGMGQVAGSASPAAGSHRYWVQCRPGMGRVAGSASPASRLPQVMGAVQVLWELACQRWGRCRVSIAGKPAPTSIGCSTGQGWDRLQDHHRRQAGSHR